MAVATVVNRKSQARKVVRGLKELYPEATCELRFSNPLELLIATILSAQCTDVRVNEVTATLFPKYPTAADLAQVSQVELEDQIKPTGFFRQKAMSVRRTARMLVDRHQGQVPKSMEEMVKLPGVARKTANVVLGTAYGIPTGVVVDTHVRRLSYRLGLSDENDPVKIEQDLMVLIPKKDWIWFGHAMIWHGRRICSARRPACSECGLRAFCPRRGL